MAGVRDHRQLDVWKLADQFRREVRQLLKQPGFGANRHLHDQLSRSAEGPCANIAEGFSRFRPRDFARFLRIARGSLAESVEHLDVAADAGILPRAEVDKVINSAQRSRGAAAALIRYLESVADGK